MGDAQTARTEGSVDAALETAAERIDAVYELPMLAHAPMEPMNCTAEFEGDRLHVYVPTQVQLVAQATAAAAAGIEPAQVDIHTTFLGGGFRPAPGGGLYSCRRYRGAESRPPGATAVGS